MFDVSTKYKLERIIANNTFASDEGDAAYIWDNSYDRARSLCEMRLTFFSRRDQLYERFEETHVQRAHTERELRGALAETGFVLSGYTTRSPLNRQNPRASGCSLLQRRIIRNRRLNNGR